jgi:hypothetical protein
MNYGTGDAQLARQARNDNRRPSRRTRADEELTLIGIVLGASLFFIAIMWLAG